MMSIQDFIDSGDEGQRAMLTHIRNNSLDSRHFGAVPQDDIVGVVLWVL